MEDIRKRTDSYVLYFMSTLIERFLIRKSEKSSFRPLFILGPARSGTTLIYQALVGGIECCYFSNIMSRYPRIPGTLTKVLGRFGHFDYIPDYRNFYGKTKGWNGPAQGSEIWSRWFPKSHEVESDVICDLEEWKLANLIHFMQRASGRPFVNKWPGLSVYVPILRKLFPNALFVRVKREPIDTALSVINGRRQLLGDESVSISRVPRGYESFSKDTPYRQVAAYVMGIEKQLDRELKGCDDAVFAVKYEEFCASPERLRASVIEWYSDLQTDNIIVKRTAAPIIIHPGSARILKDAEGEEIRKAFEYVEKFGMFIR